jgi:hypothetical protein
MAGNDRTNTRTYDLYQSQLARRIGRALPADGTCGDGRRIPIDRAAYVAGSFNNILIATARFARERAAVRDLRVGDVLEATTGDAAFTGLLAAPSAPRCTSNRRCRWGAGSEGGYWR